MEKNDKYAINLDRADLERFKELIDKSVNIVITCHRSPDGDALGSTLALWHVLCRLGKKATVITPDMYPLTLDFLPGIKSVMVASQAGKKAVVDRLLEEAQLVVCCDFNALYRIDELGKKIAVLKCPMVLIDHHLDPDSFTEITFSYPECPATCLLMYKLMKMLGYGELVDLKVATCLCTGILTDTGKLSYNNNDPGLYTAMGELMERGVDFNRLCARIDEVRTADPLRLMAYGLLERMTLYPDHKAAMIVIDDDDLLRFNYKKGDTEGLVNKPLRIRDVRWSVFLRENKKKGEVKVSMRSQGTFPVNKICELLGGGGHLNAAGAEWKDTIESCRKRIEELMPEFDQYL